MGTPLVLFRDRAGTPGALIDRCAHRNLPLSLGRVHADGCLECAYHGWRYDPTGACTAVPGLLGASPGSPVRQVETHATTEQDGFVWVWGEPGARPSGAPLAIPTIEGRGTGEVVFPYDLDCTLHAALENALDVPHTAFLHRGVFRGGDPREITAVRRDLADGIEVQYLGEPVGMGPIRRGEQGSGLTFDHWDRFLMPSTAQVEYRVEGWLRIVNTILHLPLSPFRTRAWFVVRYWTRLPAPVVRPIVSLRGRSILRQDADVLARQTANARRFGGERYASTELDVIGAGIWRRLRQAERDERDESDAQGNGRGAETDPAPRSVNFEV